MIEITDAVVDQMLNGHGNLNHEPSSLVSEPSIDIKTEAVPAKRKLDSVENGNSEHQDKRRRGTAPIKEEYLIQNGLAATATAQDDRDNRDDDAAEAFHHQDRSATDNKKDKRKKQKGQNKNRHLETASDEVGLCATRSHAPEFSPRECRFGDKCKFAHDLRKYLEAGKREDLTTFNSVCPVWQEKGSCKIGWSCRFVRSHSKEIECEDGRKELVLVDTADQPVQHAKGTATADDEDEPDVANNIGGEARRRLTRKKFPTPKSDKYIPHLEDTQRKPEEQGKSKQNATNGRGNSSSPEPDSRQDDSSTYIEAPLLPSEKRRLYFGPDTPVLAPLTTQGNLPFRRLCTSLGASFTYSEMAMSMPLLSGQRSEWALLKAHESEMQPPTFVSNDAISSLKAARSNIVYDYNHATDLKLGAQISANKPWLAIKTAEVLSTLLPKGLRVIDMNCGCPIDLVYKEGAGSALLDSPSKLDKMLRGMNAVSGEIPISAKIRMGTKTGVPTAHKLVDRLVLGAKRNQPWNEDQGRDMPCGVAAITLHGRSRQQRYTREADWDYIAETASLIQSLNLKSDNLTDTAAETDARDLPNPATSAQSSLSTPNGIHFLGNGDIYSHEDYYTHLRNSPISGCMIARGALIKPWIFEEISANQYLDKSATERLGYVEQFVRYGLSAWGSDTHGISTTRRFLLEYLSFAHRYVPIGLLEYLPPKINERPPRYKGRNEMETLLASDSYKDWIRISEMYLGKVSDAEGKKEDEYGWIPKHKSNAWDGDAQG